MTTEIRTTHSVEHNCHDNLIRDGFHVMGVPDDAGNICWGVRAVQSSGEQDHRVGKFRPVKFCPWCGEEFPTGAHPPAEVNPFKPKPWNYVLAPASPDKAQ